MRFSLLLAVLAGLILPGCGLLGPADDARAPLVNLTRPGEGAVVGGDVLLRFTGEARGDDNFISFINVSVDGEKVGEAELITPGVNPIFAYRLNSALFSDGEHRIQATAFDANQNRGLSNSVVVSFLNGIVDGVPSTLGPVASITSPREGEELMGLVQVVAQPAPGQPAVTRVDFLVDGVSVDVDTAFPYAYEWNTALEGAGPHILQARVYSGPRAFRLTSPVTVTVLEQGDPGDPDNPVVCETIGCLRFRKTGFQGEVTSSVAIGFNNDLYVATLADTLYAFTPAGSLRWKRGTNGSLRSAPVVGNNEDVFVASEDGRLYGYSSAGNLVWTPYDTGAILRSAPALAIDGTLFFGDSRGRVHAVNSFNGRPRAGFPIQVSQAAIQVPPVITRNRRVVVGSTDGVVYVLSEDGTLLGQSQNLGGITDAMALVERQVQRQLITGTRTDTVSTAYVVTDQGRLYAVALTGAPNVPVGTIEWSENLSGPQLSGPIVGNDGAVYVGTATGLAAFNETVPSGGSRLRFIVPGIDVGTPAIDANDVIYYVSGTTLKAINSNSTPVLSYELQTQTDGPLTIGRNGVLYAAGNNQLLIGINTASSGLSAGKWPMFQRNSRHTGRIGADSDDG
jgi:hypothetical protein